MAESMRQKIVDLLVAEKGIDRAKLEELLQSPASRNKTLGEILTSAKLISEQELLATLAKGLGLPPINLARYKIDPALAEVVPERLARQHRLVPVSRIGRMLSVAMADPLNVLALDDLAMLTTYEITPVLAAEKEIERATRQLYQSGADQLQEFLDQAPSDDGQVREAEEEVMELTAFGMAGKKAPIVKVVDLMISEALKARASDLHIEPYEEDVRVRYRVDGSLQEVFRVPKRYQNAFLTRLKILAQMDITENRLPQDGRFKARLESKEVDFRVSALPITFGNKMVLRVLDKSSLSVGLDQLGLLPDSLTAFQKAIARPYGLILVTGPTGSGKSTTLYSVLTQMNEPGKNIMTIEDPVEYQLDGVTQVQVNSEIQLTFANALRAFLRQAPDVVLVGEIRDGETADIAIKASLTGQIVLSTLHTNDAASAVARLLDMGVDPFLLSSSLTFVAAQRLCRQICSRCKVPDEEGDAKLKALGIRRPEGVKTLFRGKGCSYCRKTGYRGRFAILEAMMVDDGIREMIIGGRSPDQIKEYALSHGMRSLRQEGMEHCLAGRTTPEEVLRVTSEE
ncbi:MAG: Flp pilus assembly complex ATPase component TadA [Candidatus Omnitrophica bacterium]|nr:Flp pilus assembly complex ATPase component TadA [Candidatus Omnitrophota bacterium]